MKFFVSLILTILLSLVASLYMPWWGFALVAFLVSAAIHQKPGKAFLCGFTALFLLWGGLAFWMDMKNQSLLSHKVAQVLPLGGNQMLLILVTAFIGALVGGMASLTGSYLRQTAKK
jgi:hypothetical protein